MASLFVKNNKIYMSWWDRFEGKTKNRSLRLENNKENMKLAKELAKEFKKRLEAEIKKLEFYSIENHDIKTTQEHFLRVNSQKEKNTIYGYKFFFSMLNQRFDPAKTVKQISKNSIEEWLIELSRLNKAKNTLYGYYKVLKKYLRFLFEYNYVPPFNINSNIAYKGEIKKIIIFKREHLKKIKRGLSNKNDNFKTMIYLLIYTGLRPSDIINIEVDDIDFEVKSISYYSQKIDEPNIIPIHPKLLSFLKFRCENLQTGRIINYENTRNMGKAFNRYLADLSLSNYSYNLRTFRKTFVSLAHESGMDLATVANLVGHKKITTTQRYYHKLGMKKKQEEIIKLDI